MKVTGHVSSILSYKGSTIWSVAPDKPVSEAIALMAEKNIGVVLVMDGGQLLGVMSERDYTRKVFLKGRSSKETQVKEIMGSSLITVTPQHSVDECLHIMTDRRIRHLPVLENGKVVGLVSIGDLVNWVISAQSATIDQLQSYISGGYPGHS
jgi:CBS domain-containing protein